MLRRIPRFLRVSIVLAIVAATLLASPAEAQWKWRDKSGHTQYSDLPPPPGVAEQDILSKPGSQQRSTRPVAAPASAGFGVAASGAASAGLSPRLAEPELETKRKKQEAEAAAKTKAEDTRIAAARADNCSRARSQLATLDSGVRLIKPNEKGERIFMDDKQRADEQRRARETISAACK